MAVLPQALIVASAGNDYYVLPEGRKLPRRPAAYDNVLGVAALKYPSGGQPRASDYSNEADEAAASTGPATPSPAATPRATVGTVSNGVAVWGGNASRKPGQQGLPTSDFQASPVDAVRGVFTRNPLPLNSGPNELGWGYWTGTSFAAPVVSALAAVHWSQNPNAGPADVIRAIRTTYATMPTSITNLKTPVPWIDVTQI
jgi:subtilisin family serine protease